LAIVRDIVHRHGGNIRYDEDWTLGARFVVELPNSGS
jgi:signal transduction histidine kinase